MREIIRAFAPRGNQQTTEGEAKMSVHYKVPHIYLTGKKDNFPHTEVSLLNVDDLQKEEAVSKSGGISLDEVHSSHGGPLVNVETLAQLFVRERKQLRGGLVEVLLCG